MFSGLELLTDANCLFEERKGYNLLFSLSWRTRIWWGHDFSQRRKWSVTKERTVVPLSLRHKCTGKKPTGICSYCHSKEVEEYRPRSLWDHPFLSLQPSHVFVHFITISPRVIASFSLKMERTWIYGFQRIQERENFRNRYYPVDVLGKEKG